MADQLKADFCIEVQYQPHSIDPSRVFRSMSALIEGFQQIDHNLVQSISNKIEPVLMLEDIEVGSLKTWLANKLNDVPDDALKNLNWKPIVGTYLVRAKKAMVDFMGGKTKLSFVNEIQPLQDKLDQLATETDIRWIPLYVPVGRRELLEGLNKIADGTSPLNPKDKAIYITPEGNSQFNLQFQLAPENVESILTKDTIISDLEMILKVKKPDYLGDSMWEFRWGDHNFLAIISDKEWVTKFQSRMVTLHPGDSLRSKVRKEDKYGFDGELTKTTHDIIKVLEVISYGEQLQLSPP